MSEGNSEKSTDLGVKDPIHPGSTTVINMFSHLKHFSLSHRFCLGLKTFVVITAAFGFLFIFMVFQDGSDIIE